MSDRWKLFRSQNLREEGDRISRSLICTKTMNTCITPFCTPRQYPCCCKDGPGDGGCCGLVNDQRDYILPPTSEERQTPSLCRAVSPIGNSENFPGDITCIDSSEVKRNEEIETFNNYKFPLSISFSCCCNGLAFAEFSKLHSPFILPIILSNSGLVVRRPRIYFIS